MINHYTISNELGDTLQLSNLGASILAFIGPYHIDYIVGNKDFHYSRQIEQYPYFGHCIGPLSGRTSTQPFSLGDEEVILDGNENVSVSIHGGFEKNALSFMTWDADTVESKNFAGKRFSISIRLASSLAIVTCIIALAKNTHCIHIEYKVESAQDFPINLTNHSYFNLGNSTILDDYLHIAASYVYELDELGLLTGSLLSVDNTPLDLRVARPLSTVIEALNEDRKGIDHVFLLDKSKSQETVLLSGAMTKLHHASSLRSKQGTVLDTFTSLPALVCYTGNYLSSYKHGEQNFADYSAICFETQYPSGFTHIENLPQSYARKQEAWKECTEYVFSFD